MLTRGTNKKTKLVLCPIITEQTIYKTTVCYQDVYSGPLDTVCLMPKCLCTYSGAGTVHAAASGREGFSSR